jgi:hypothetical protein
MALLDFDASAHTCSLRRCCVAVKRVHASYAHVPALTAQACSGARTAAYRGAAQTGLERLLTEAAARLPGQARVARAGET